MVKVSQFMKMGKPDMFMLKYLDAKKICLYNNGHILEILLTLRM